MGRIARVVPEVSLDQEFDYAVPAALEVPLGAKVRVPFAGRQIVGYVVDFPAQASVPKLKEIIAVLPASLPPMLIKLRAGWPSTIARRWPWRLKTVLPQAVRRADAAFKQRLWVAPRVAELPEEAALALKKNKAQVRAWQHLLEHGPNCFPSWARLRHQVSGARWPSVIWCRLSTDAGSRSIPA